MVFQALFGTTLRSVLTGVVGSELLGIDIPFLGDGGGGGGGGTGLFTFLVFGLFVAGLAAVAGFLFGGGGN